MTAAGETAAVICRTLGVSKTTLYKYLVDDEAID